ncbi:porphobilinogen synthase [soil metagenome]
MSLDTSHISNRRSGFPQARPRRLRSHPLLRELVRETSLSTADLILPLFVRTGSGIRKPIASMPGNSQLSPDTLVTEVREALDLGVRSFMLFGIPASKDATGSSALADDGIVQESLRRLRDAFSDQVYLIADECFCEYTDHGHCGILKEKGGKLDLDNDATLPLLAEQCVSHAKAGVDMVAPSGMLDGMVGAIRAALDGNGFKDLPILSYAAKYSSGFYGPFRDAAESPPQFGDRSTYQMDPANSDEAIREVALDLAEGADLVMVKPALSYLDIIYRVKQQFGVPVAAYNVSGEFAMVKAAAANGWIDERRVTLEILTSIKRAGSDMILTYSARDVARWLK